MKGLVHWAAHNVLLSLMLVGFLTMLGVAVAARLPIDAVPDVTNIQVQVVTRAPALSAQEVEVQVTQPIERAMAGTPGLTQTRSITKFGISIVTMVFTDAVDIYFARAQVNERLSGVRDTIPADVGRPELGPIATGLGEIFMFELRPTTEDARSDEELRTIIDWQIGPRLRQVPGVIEVVGFGGAVKQYKVSLDPARLSAHQVSVEEVRAALERDNRLSGGGYIERGGEQVVLRGDARFRGVEDISNTVVRTEDRGIPLRVGQLGEVDTGPALRQGAMTRDGRGEVVGASVLMLKGENSREVVTRIKDAIEEMKPYLPAGITIEPWYDRADYITRVIRTVAKNLTEGALIVIACLLLTLGSIRAGLLVAGAIPFSLLVGIIGLKLLGYSGNVMSLGAIDFGIVVEGTVVVVEHAVTHAGSMVERAQKRNAIIHAMAEVARPAVFGVIITLLVFLPLASLEDVEGKMFRPVVFSLCFMLAGSLVYALVLVPALAPGLLAKASSEQPWLMRRLRGGYEPLLRSALDRPKATLAGVFAIAGLMLAAGSTRGAEFLPRIFEGAFAIDTVRPPSASLTTAIALSKEAEQALRETPEVQTVVSRIGRPEGSVDPAGPESSDTFVMLKDRSEWREGVTPESLIEELSNRLESRVPATLNAFSQPIEMRVNDLIAGVKGDIAIKLFGEDLTELRDIADKIRRRVSQVPGAADVKMEIPFGLPSVKVSVDRERVGRLGASPGSVLDTLTMARAGLPVGVVREGERVFDLMLLFGKDELTTDEQLARLPIATHQGKLVPLSSVARVKSENTVVQISREQMRRRLVVQANVRGRDMVGFVQEAQQAVAALNVPKSVEVVWGGQFQNFNRAKARLFLLMPICLAVIALMLVVTFKSAAYMMATVLNLPFAIAGGLFALVIRDFPISIPAGVGFIAVSGVAVITGIVMTSKMLELPLGMAPKDRAFEAASRAFRAPVSTSLVAAIGFVPAAIATGTGSEVQKPLATVVIGGLLVAMCLSLYALPVMLMYIAKWQDRGTTGSTVRSPSPSVAH
jgi:cobalt-zinc-cadmium resistance protein CzcA